MITTDVLKDNLSKLKAGEQEMMLMLTKQRGAIEFCQHLITESTTADTEDKEEKNPA